MWLAVMIARTSQNAVNHNHWEMEVHCGYLRAIMHMVMAVWQAKEEAYICTSRRLYLVLQVYKVAKRRMGGCERASGRHITTQQWRGKWCTMGDKETQTESRGNKNAIQTKA